MTRTEDILDKLGVSRRYDGRDYVSTAVEWVMRDEDYLRDVVKKLYTEIGEHYQDSVENVIRDIRTVVEVAYRKNRSCLELMARRKLDARPTPVEFIEIIAVYQMREGATAAGVH